MNPTEPASIPARSHSEAMELSLVLVSQGIEPVIDRAEEDGGWRLVVTAEEFPRAVESIRLYRLENRNWPWQHRVSLPGYVFDWGSLAWAGLLVFFFAVDSRSGLRGAGVMDAALLAKGQWWRCFTAVWLHADLSHLVTNLTTGFLLVGLAMGRFGTGIGSLAAYLAGAAGNLCPWLIGLRDYRSLGASGMIMAALGLLAAQSLAAGRQAPRAVRFGSLVAGLMLFALYGLSPKSDVLGHAGGFVGGLLLGALLARIPSPSSAGPANLAAGLGFVALTVIPWGLALARG